VSIRAIRFAMVKITGAVGGALSVFGSSLRADIAGEAETPKLMKY
jgi:hypothetical protein